jgi:hypothetical protein
MNKGPKKSRVAEHLAQHLTLEGDNVLLHYEVS